MSLELFVVEIPLKKELNLKQCLIQLEFKRGDEVSLSQLGEVINSARLGIPVELRVCREEWSKAVQIINKSSNLSELPTRGIGRHLLSVSTLAKTRYHHGL